MEKNHFKSTPFSFPSLYEKDVTLRGVFANASDAFEGGEVVPKEKLKNITVILAHGAFIDHRDVC